ncbi:PepSY domain-containing protein [Thomasclavelia sp.]|uniref:PepSY domain-containing protein n=1 Tax=Thomasclavelia sp. TaxID=3025757 RepID=UPI002601144B|nr:PepSY domain-containing protein [Thomasclavelia sp.]
MKKIISLVLLVVVLVGCGGNNKTISMDEAKEIALKEVNGEVVRYEEDRDDGRTYYEFEIIADNKKYDLEVDGETGDIIKKEIDEDYVGNTNQNNNASTTATISQDEAKKIAEDRIGTGGNLIKCELDSDDGVLKYEIEIIKDNIKYEIDVNANTGEIVKYEEER